MRVESNRIFISDLPETATKDEIERAFGEYGDVTHIEIKERKELGLKNTSLFFAYVSLNTDPKKLQNCFKDFTDGKWLGQYVMLQVARESFLDRLKKERENNQGSVKSQELTKDPIPPAKEKSREKQEQKSNGVNFNKVDTKKIESSDSDSSFSEEEEKSSKSTSSKKVVNKIISENVIEHDPDFVIKNNKGKSLASKVLKIESVGREPIITIDKSKKNAITNTSAANLKRLESLKNLKMGYQNQKSLIQAALANVDTKPTNKIVFDTRETVRQKEPIDKNSLFNESGSEEEFEPTFSVKEHFQGKQGQKLLELQSKYKHDKRFTLNERFLDGNEMESQEIETNLENNEDISLEEEKKKEYQILEQVLGKKIIPKDDKQNSSKKKMLRFDPSQPEHSKFEIEHTAPEKKRKRNRRDSNTEMAEKGQEEKSVPEVSKEVFFKVSDNLKQTFEEKKEFSLLSMFGNQDKEKTEDMEIEKNIEKVSNNLYKEKNPFKYDSSDDEDETEDIPKQNTFDDTKKTDLITPNINNNIRKTHSWTDPFFFKLDDYRLQEGFDFVEKMKSEEKTEFTKLRRDLKEIVKAKVRNNQRKNKPFKKKLGGNKKKKMLRMKKAMKR